MIRKLTILLLSMAMTMINTAAANDAFSIKNIGLDLANDLRDDLAPRFTLQISEEKANLAVMAGTSSADFRSRRDDIRAEMNHLDGIIVMEGALEIIAGGARLGAIGVSGAPGGDIDQACAQKALDKYADRLEFIE